jgi:hypothetical protein
MVAERKSKRESLKRDNARVSPEPRSSVFVVWTQVCVRITECCDDSVDVRVSSENQGHGVAFIVRRRSEESGLMHARPYR